jgi:hypothetical protein
VATAYYLPPFHFHTASFVCLSCQVICSPPDDQPTVFNSQLYVNNSTAAISLSADQHLLLRGCQLRNTSWVIGMVCYTGHETKIMMQLTSSGFAPSKVSSIERAMNKYIYVSFAVLLVACLITCIPAGIWVAADAKSAWCAVLSHGRVLPSPVRCGRPARVSYAVWPNDCLGLRGASAPVACLRCCVVLFAIRHATSRRWNQ